MRILSVAGALALSLALVSVADARSKRHHHYDRDRYVPVPTFADVFFPPPDGPPHMVEVKPGYTISSWGCVTDEGGGRLKPCDTGRN